MSEEENEVLMPRMVRKCINVKCVALITLALISLGTSGVSLSLLITTTGNAPLYTGLIASNMGILVGLLASPKRIFKN